MAQSPVMPSIGMTPKRGHELQQALQSLETSRLASEGSCLVATENGRSTLPEPTPADTHASPLRCRKCGSNRFVVPSHSTVDSLVTCADCGAGIGRWATFESASLKKPKLRRKARQDGKPSAVLLPDSLAAGIPLKGPDVAGWSKRVVPSPEDESHRLLENPYHVRRGEREQLLAAAA